MITNSGVWWCVRCQKKVPADCVTWEERHDVDGVGCGEEVEWIKTEEWNRLAALAEQAGVDPKLLWVPAEMCPWGHANQGETAIGDLCIPCLENWLGPKTDVAVYDHRWNEFAAQHGNLDWHPEWRIAKTSRDLRDPGVVIPIVEAYCAITGYGWNLHQSCDPDDGIESYFYGGPDQEWLGHAPHGYPMEAMAQALLAVLEGGEE